MFYTINYSTDLSVFGDCEFPQIQDFDMSDITQPKYLNFEVEGLLPSTSKLPRYKMHKDAKITDLISAAPLSSRCLIISKKVAVLISNLNLPMHQFFELSFLHRNVIYDQHSAFYIAKDSRILKTIDWSQSEFFKTKDYHSTIISTHKFNDWENMVMFDKSLWGGDYGLLRKLKIKFPSNFDIVNFHFFGFPPGYICTEKVKNLIDDNGFTGFKFVPVEEGIFID